LETICFNFSSRLPFSFVIKLGRDLHMTKDLIKLSWHLAVDSHRTLAPLMYPPHVIGLACIYLGALLTSFETHATAPLGGNYQTSHDICAILCDHGLWEERYSAHVEDMEDVVHVMLDLLHSLASTAPSSHNTSPRTPSSPSTYGMSTTAFVNANASSGIAAILASSTTLTRLKIALKEKEHEPRERIPLSQTDPTAGLTPSEADGIGKNEGTVRFLFGPPSPHNSQV